MIYIFIGICFLLVAAMSQVAQYMDNIEAQNAKTGVCTCGGAYTLVYQDADMMYFKCTQCGNTVRVKRSIYESTDNV